MPGETTSIEFTVTIDFATASILNSGNGTLNDILILRLEKGRDYYISLTGNYARSCFGMTLDELVMYNVPIRSVPLDAEKRAESGIAANASLCIPKELWRILDSLNERGLNYPDLFSVPGLEKECREIRECLDTGNLFLSQS